MNKNTGIFDAHIHVGQFYKTYYSPAEISKLMHKCEVASYLVSSTSVCTRNITQSIKDIAELISIDGEMVYPCLWLTESILETSDLEIFLKTDIPWICLKIHTALNPNEWISNGSHMAKLISLAKELKLPILIHTGYEEWCRADKYELDIARNPEVKFILAHGRPYKAAYRMLRSFENVYIDTSFMPVHEIVDILNSSKADRVIWGSDTPIPARFYKLRSYKKYYNAQLISIKASVSGNVFANFIYHNAIKLFSK